MSEHDPHAHGPVVETHSGHSAHAAHTNHAGPPTGIAKYIYVFIALCLLTTMSFFTTSDWWREHFTPSESRMLMLAVSCCKALLVILFFMHVLYEANWKFVLTIPAAMMSLFLILMLVPDVGLRLRTASQERRFHMAQEKSAGHMPADNRPPTNRSAEPPPAEPQP